MKIARKLPSYFLITQCVKGFKRFLHDQLYKYFTEHKLFFDNQYGFRRNHSTEHAAMEIVDRIVNSMDKGEVPLNIYLDLSKSFDTLDHEILLCKLEYYGGISLKLLKNYLFNRKQYVFINDACSSLSHIHTGVQQGSIMGPLLFIIYLNDLMKACNMFKPIVYADDALFAVLEAFGNNNLDLERYINREIQLICTWFKVNKLSINGLKTKAMIFPNLRKKVYQIFTIIVP